MANEQSSLLSLRCKRWIACMCVLVHAPVVQLLPDLV